MTHLKMVYLLNMVIFHGYVGHNQRVIGMNGGQLVVSWHASLKSLNFSVTFIDGIS
jgi:hypothetical protein